MTRYFMKFTPLFAAEVQMMTPPRHQPRRSGRIRSSFRYSADDVRCKDCTRYDSGQPCHLNECVCLEERIEAGVVELNTLARECFGGRMFRPLQRRLRDELNRQPFRFFLGDAHRERWTHWKNRCYGMSGRNAAALFLLTADEELWQRVLWHFDSSGFDFSAIRLSGIHPELYSIYQAAKTISVGGDNIVIQSSPAGGGSVSYFDSIYADTLLPPRAVSVYMYLKDRSNSAGSCWPGIKTIARDMNLSRSTVKRALADLEQHGYLAKLPRYRPNGSNTSNLYTLK